MKMNLSNEVWWEVAMRRSENIQRWKRREQILKQIRVVEPTPGWEWIPATEDADLPRAGAGQTDVLSLGSPSEDWAGGYQ